MKRNINEIFNKNDFAEIIHFVLKKGNRQTYCNKYNNNPHYYLKEKDMHIYLNPVNQHINYYEENLSSSASDYNQIVLLDHNSPFWYYDLMRVDDDVFINNIYENDPQKYETEIVEKYIPLLKKLI